MNGRRTRVQEESLARVDRDLPVVADADSVGISGRRQLQFLQDATDISERTTAFAEPRIFGDQRTRHVARCIDPTCNPFTWGGASIITAT